MAEIFEPAIEREMRIPELHMPPDSKFEPKFTADQVKDFDKRDVDILKAVSRLQQMTIWMINEMIAMNGHMRRMEAEQIQARGFNKFMGLAKSVVIFIVGAIAIELVKGVSGKWIK